MNMSLSCWGRVGGEMEEEPLSSEGEEGGEEDDPVKVVKVVKVDDNRVSDSNERKSIISCIVDASTSSSRIPSRTSLNSSGDSDNTAVK